MFTEPEVNNCFSITVQVQILVSNSVIDSVNKESTVHSLYNCSDNLYQDKQEVLPGLFNYISKNLITFF